MGSSKLDEMVKVEAKSQYRTFGAALGLRPQVSRQLCLLQSIFTGRCSWRAEILRCIGNPEDSQESKHAFLGDHDRLRRIQLISMDALETVDLIFFLEQTRMISCEE